MKKTLAVPDAWDDDWETQADGANAREDAPTTVEDHQQQQQQQHQHQHQQPLTKAERLMQHAEANRKLWKSADEPQTFHYLEASNNVPLTSTFKPQVKVLSRKPTVAKDPVVGLARLSSSSASAAAADDDNDDDDDDADKNTTPLNPEQIRAKQKRVREEKQKRYDEARAKIFGDSAPSSRGSSPVTVTPPRSADGGRHQHPHHSAGQGRSRGRGGGQRADADARQQQQQQQQPDMRRQNSQARELYDPNCSSSKPDAAQPRKGPDGDVGKGPSPKDELLQPIRAPRGPDSSGRGGFGFARRGSKEG